MSRSVMKTRDVLKLVRDMIALNNPELDFLNLVTTNTIDKLPAPDNMKELLPALLVNSNATWNTNADNSKGIIVSRFCLDLTYLRHFDDEEEQVITEMMYEETDKIADFLLDSEHLSRYNLTTGEIMETWVPHVEYMSQETGFFRDLKLPVLTSHIEYDIWFRTYKKGVVR